MSVSYKKSWHLLLNQDMKKKDLVKISEKVHTLLIN